MIFQIVMGKLPRVPRMMLPFVDVRDCARGHILALQKGETGERYLLTGDMAWMLDAA